VSRSAEGRERRDRGFTLVEIVVALGILMVVLVALLPQLVVGLRATGVARQVTQAKGISQGQLEEMRNLPFHIAPAAGDFIDVLDRFYPDLTAPAVTPVCSSGGAYASPQVGWSGYVAAGSGARCDYEPATGAFYRTVEQVPAVAGSGGFTLVVDTQFLSGATPPVPVSPASGYHTRTVGRDSPASSQVGVTATVFYRDRGTVRPVSTSTQIAERLPTLSRLRAEASARVLEVSSVVPGTPSGVPLTLSAGLLDLTGSVSFASTVSASLAATSAGLATGERGGGAEATGSAPPATPVAPVNRGAGLLTPGGCAYACWGSTGVTGFDLTSADGLPRAGSATSPAQVLLTDTANNGLTFGNTSTAGDYRPALELAPVSAPVLLQLDDAAAGAVASGLSGCGLGSTGTPAYLSASGYLETTTTDVAACSVGRSAVVELFPTTFAPNGVVRVRLEKAAAGCRLATTAHTPSTTVDYRAVVEYYDGDASDGSPYTVAATVVPGQTTNQLDAVPLTTPIGGGSRTLGTYISSWSSVTVGRVVDAKQAATASQPATAEVTVPGVVTISSQPVRTGPDPLDPADPSSPLVDPASSVSLTLGALACRVEDDRR
jgi:type II secretory pathway pseudopilin PulG